VVTRRGFTRVVKNAFSSAGFSSEASLVVFPSKMFLPGSDLSPIDTKMGDLIEGLTVWEPTVRQKGLKSPPKVTVKGRDYKEAARILNDLFLKNMWGDGLPVVPPTKEKVDWILKGTDKAKDEVIGTILPRGGIATVEAIAVSLAMAGGRPEYLPVLIATVKALTDPALKHERMNTTTNSVYPVVVVNGRIATDIRLNSAYGCLGPDPRKPAGASLGRALRFLLMNLGGALPGEGTMSIYGGPARYTGLVFAEDELGIPESWKALNVEQGFPEDSDTVTLYCVASTTNVPGGETGTEKAAIASLNRAAAFMGTPNGNYWFVTYESGGPPGILLMARGTAQGLAEMGWSKKKVKEYLWEHSKVPASELGPRVNTWWMPSEDMMEDPMPITKSPEEIKIVVAGGEQSGHMMWLEVGCCPTRLTSAEIELPENWNGLLEQALEDLGPPHFSQ